MLKRIMLHPSVLLIVVGLAILLTTDVMSDVIQTFESIMKGFETINHALR